MRFAHLYHNRKKPVYLAPYFANVPDEPIPIKIIKSAFLRTSIANNNFPSKAFEFAIVKNPKVPANLP